MDPLVAEQDQSAGFFNPITFVLQFLADYGWYLVGAGAGSLYLMQRLRPHVQSWRQAREDAEYHKDPDAAAARMAAIQRARDEQQRRLEAASRRAKELQLEREEKKRQENLERLQKYGAESAGERLGADEDYMPLSAGASTSSYRPPKRSACARGGCGR